jgi:hypothetical protein
VIYRFPSPRIVLYVPPLWFHHVTSLTPSLSVSVWSPNVAIELAAKVCLVVREAPRAESFSFSTPSPLSHYYPSTPYHRPRLAGVGGRPAAH